MSEAPASPTPPSSPSSSEPAAPEASGAVLSPLQPVTLQPVTVRRGAGDDDVQGSLWQQIGGRATFERLVRRFYEGVRTDPVLWPMYPADDLEGAIQRLTGFLEQYWGGPSAYSDERGHPRLRMRHLPFKVNPDARDRWLGHMRTALDSLDLAPLHDATLWAYLERAAHAMVNTFDE